MRAVIYARYSDPRQNPASLRDQISVCRGLIEREGYELVEIYTDAHISAAATANRPGFLQLMADARARRFDVVVVEALDRFSRGMADVTGAFEDLQAASVFMHTLSEGVVDELHIGLKGTMNALFLKDLTAKTRRGMVGVLSEGRLISTPYGYRVVRKIGEAGEIIVGLREIDEAQATVVRRIFADYAAGLSPRAVCNALNAEGVPAPAGGAWAAVRLQAHRRGILRNEVYRGVAVWGKTRSVKDRATGRRREVVANPDAVVRVARPELRIIDDELWERVQQRLAATAAPTPARAQAQRRPKRLLSGIMFCGCCGSSMNLSAGDVTSGGRAARFRCSGKLTKGAAFCSNGGTVPMVDAERRVLTAVRDRLLRPEMVEGFVREAHRLSAEKARTSGADRGRLERELGEVRRKTERLVDQVADGVLGGATVAGKIRDLEARAETLEREMAATANAANVVTMHPAAAGHYRQMIDDLAAALPGDGASESAAREAFRNLVGAVRMIPGGKRGVYELEIVGHMQSVMAVLAGGAPIGAGDQLGEFRILG